MNVSFRASGIRGASKDATLADVTSPSKMDTSKMVFLEIWPHNMPIFLISDGIQVATKTL
jgi:hypothetical protein